MSDNRAVQAVELSLRGPRRTDGHEVDIGTYHIFQNDRVTGELLVRADPEHVGDPNYVIEHWGLYSSFVSPSPDRPDTTLRFVYTRMDYGGSEEDFVSHLGTIGGVRYITATCCARML